MTATVIQLFKPKAAPPGIRKRSIVLKLWEELLGMTHRQSQMAWELSLENLERRKLTHEALIRLTDAMEPFEIALEGYREELLKNLHAHCPRAAKRIREGKPPRTRRAK
jgi:hypothetical protein